MATECNHEWHNTGLAFCTIPESPMQACIHCGEQRVHQENIDDKFAVTQLECDICQESMSMAKLDGRVIFECTNSACKQSWSFCKEGDKIRSSCTVLKTLWPSKMKEGDKMFREKYLPSRLEEWKFHAKAKHLAGFMTEEEMREDFAESEQMISEWYENNPEELKIEEPEGTQPKKSWWKFW